MTAVLITGATGFVGSELARALLCEPWTTRVLLLARPAPGLSAAERIARLTAYWSRYFPPLPPEALAKATILEHDLEAPEPPLLPFTVEYILHAAASTDLDVSLAASRRANLHATQKLLATARAQPTLRRFLHFSTAYVSGARTGVIREGDAAPRVFHNAYERAKREAEACVAQAGVPFTTLRPSIIVGRSDNGYVMRMKVLYAVWRVWLAGNIPRAPVDPGSWIDLVPVDYVVLAALALLRLPESAGEVVHLVAGGDRQSPLAVMRAAATAFAVPLPPLSPPWVVSLLRSPPVRPLLAHALREILDKMHWQVPYIGMRGRLFDAAKADALLGGRVARPAFAEYGERLFQFCRDTAWGKRPLRLDHPAARGRPGPEVLCSPSAS